MSEKSFNILLGCTGSVATIKIPNIVRGLKDEFGEKAIVRLISTKNAKFFLPEDLSQVQFANFKLLIYLYWLYFVAISF
jgi:hypothetical protein